MNTVITNFANQYLSIGKGLMSSTVSVVNAYVAFNNGSTAGKLKLYAYIQALEGVSKVRSEFHGVRLIEPTTAEPVTPPATQPTAATAAAEPVAKQSGMSEYERLCIEAKNKKIEQMRIDKERELAEARALKEKELELKEKEMTEARKTEERKIEMKELKMRQTYEMEMSKLQFKSQCFERTMSFQKEVNNMNRRMNAGYIDRKTEYVVLGTASNVHIEYDSAIDNLNELKYEDDLKEPIKKCFDDQVVDLEMVDKTKERAISLKAMINIHAMIISKLDTNEISEELKESILDEYDNIAEIVDDIKVSEDNIKHYIDISNSEIVRLKEIETEARLYARVHTRSYNRCINENTKKGSKIGRKSMLPVVEYVVSENNIRSIDGSIFVDCYCCSKELNIKDALRSHVVAKELGGTCDKENIRVCCKQCNLDMGIMDLEAYKVSLKC